MGEEFRFVKNDEIALSPSMTGQLATAIKMISLLTELITMATMTREIVGGLQLKSKTSTNGLISYVNRIWIPFKIYAIEGIPIGR